MNNFRGSKEYSCKVDNFIYLGYIRKFFVFPKANYQINTNTTEYTFVALILTLILILETMSIILSSPMFGYWYQRRTRDLTRLITYTIALTFAAKIGRIVFLFRSKRFGL